MNDYPSISVIVATYHREESLMDCLESVMAQDYAGPIEIIVVEQGRRHSHPELGSFFSLHHEKITHTDQQEPNLPRARNTGVAAARNELLIFVDDDMVLAPDAMNRLAYHVLPGSCRAVAGLPISTTAREGSFGDYERIYGKQIRNAKSGLIEHPSYIPSPFCIPRELYRALGGFDENLGKLSPPAFGEDDEFWLRAGKSGVRLFIDPSLRVEHRDHLAGGCDSRQAAPEMALKYHMKSTAYIRIKHYGRLGLSGWIQVSRGYLLNRAVLRQGLRKPLQNFLTLRVAIRGVKMFMAGNCAEHSAPGTMCAHSREPGRILTP